MNTSFRFVLDRSSKKFKCNKCGNKSLVRYIDTNTGEFLPIEYGRCDKETRCSYHFNPYKEGYLKQVEGSDQIKIINRQTPVNPLIPLREKKTILFDWDTFLSTLNSKGYSENTFVQNLLLNVPFPFEVEDLRDVIKLYKLGTIISGNRKGAITFPFIDIEGGVRAIQVKQFDKLNHTINGGTDFLHSMIQRECDYKKYEYPEWLNGYLQQERKVSCLFGEHLLRMFPENPVALVEAPKTAIYGALYFGLPCSFHDLIWLAVYNKSSFSIEKLSVLQRRKVLVFPDLSEHSNTFKEWRDKAEIIQNKYPSINFIFSDLLEKGSNDIDRNRGLDLADYLIQYDWRVFRGFSSNLP